MKKVLILFALLFCIGFTKVYAADEAFEKVKNRATQIVNEQLDGSASFNASINGNKVIIDVTMNPDVRQLTLDYDANEGKLIYRRSDQRTTEERNLDRMVLGYLLSATSDVLNQGTTGSSILNNLSAYNYTNYGVEGTITDGNVITLTLNIKYLNMAGTNTSSTYNTSSNTNNNNNNNNTNNNTEKNPKTGVFVPVFGLSVLIVASVGCLVWLSRKTAVKF